MKRGLPASIAVAALSTSVSLVAVELAYRAALNGRYKRQLAAFRGETWKLVPGSPMGYRLPASHEGRVRLQPSDESVAYRTNADGFRDGPRDPDRRAGPRVLVLGDSYTFGWGVADDEPYPQRAEALLRERGIGAEVINAGIPGYNSEQEASLLDELLPRYRPDMVVVGYVMNDAEPQMSVPQPPALTYRYAASWAWADLREQAVRRLGGDPEWVSPDKSLPASDYARGFEPDSRKWRESKAALARMAAGCRRAGIPMLVMILPDFTQPFDGRYPDAVIHRAVTEWGRDLGFETTDLMTVFQGRDHRSLVLAADGHPNQAAHAAIAEVLRDRIVAGLRLESAGAGPPVSRGPAPGRGPSAAAAGSRPIRRIAP